MPPARAGAISERRMRVAGRDPGRERARGRVPARHRRSRRSLVHFAKTRWSLMSTPAFPSLRRAGCRPGTISNLWEIPSLFPARPSVGPGSCPLEMIGNADCPGSPMPLIGRGTDAATADMMPSKRPSGQCEVLCVSLILAIGAAVRRRLTQWPGDRGSNPRLQGFPSFGPKPGSHRWASGQRKRPCMRVRSGGPARSPDVPACPLPAVVGSTAWRRGGPRCPSNSVKAIAAAGPAAQPPQGTLDGGIASTSAITSFES